MISRCTYIEKKGSQRYAFFHVVTEELHILCESCDTNSNQALLFMQTQQHTTTLKRDSQIASVFSVFMQLCFQEEPSNGWFPELQDLPSSVTFMDMKLVGFQRITSLGCQTGYLQCALVDLASNSKSYVLRLFLCQICTRLVLFRPNPIMLQSLPIILSRISQIIHLPFFSYYSEK